VARIEDGVDAPIRAEDLVDGLPKHLLASAGREILPLALVSEGKGECAFSQTDDLDMVEQHQPGEPALRLDDLENVGPHPAYTGKIEPAGSGCHGGDGCAR
jgi:hypothetical protein